LTEQLKQKSAEAENLGKEIQRLNKALQDVSSELNKLRVDTSSF